MEIAVDCTFGVSNEFPGKLLLQLTKERAETHIFINLSLAIDVANTLWSVPEHSTFEEWVFRIFVDELRSLMDKPEGTDVTVVDWDGTSYLSFSVAEGERIAVSGKLIHYVAVEDHFKTKDKVLRDFLDEIWSIGFGFQAVLLDRPAITNLIMELNKFLNEGEIIDKRGGQLVTLRAAKHEQRRARKWSD